MSLRTALIALATTLSLSLATDAAAQTNPRLVGGGCAGRLPPSATGSFTIGSILTLDTGCVNSPGTSRFMLFGLALPRPQWVPIMLQTSITSISICDVSVVPVIVVADFSSQRDPIDMPIPNDPFWSGFRLGLQSYCVECGFAGCFPALTPGIEVTIQ